jgi:hypothetical protein
MFKPSRNTVLSYHPVLEKSSFFFLFLHNPNDLFIQKDFLFIYIPIVVCCKIVPSRMALIRYDERGRQVEATQSWQVYMDEHYDDAKMARIYPNAKTK